MHAQKKQFVRRMNFSSVLAVCRCVTSGPDSVVHDEYQQGRMNDIGRFFDVMHLVNIPNKATNGQFDIASDEEEHRVSEWPLDELDGFTRVATLQDCVERLGIEPPPISSM